MAPSRCHVVETRGFRVARAERVVVDTERSSNAVRSEACSEDARQPLGFFDTVHHVPVARQAGIALHHGVRFQGLGLFLTDARMHRGSSGSLVLARLKPAGSASQRWCRHGVHSGRRDMAARDATQDESPGLNCAWYADVPMTLTASRP